ncbi:hypothetical protein TVAG_300680 [Trichomonas vaginalis G3]|uniref:VWFA domain-containing protein n=1 Tax=Trichomonas vaginalis (strain ATCC PRA-98 / G3) TaxID=412133 RepID=A2EP48_TRIV3|nr:nuclear chaperone required for maturation and nuclear export of pre-60s ribosome subunits [Trichomonas vaginalis G3]EAY05586.1 hypothetical protein TVAG_300680 [Trichomonas vaginalis G3]KAI5547510.1 nuclear chaperone required for maturation and nuclear export of pre-60s ribosome subunits [Trichomonas vaginalis G3]|eukprot:XP_001317809.1 hypothetical protein [Trichomonas vaginalis G3]
MFYEVNKIADGGFNKCEKFIETFFKGFSKGNLENKEKTVKLSLSQNKINITCSFKPIKSTDSQFICVSENLQTSMTRICEVTDNSEFDFIPKSNNSIFGLEDFERNISDNFNTEEMFTPNKAMQYIASEKGSGISMSGLIRFIITDGQDQRFRLEKKAGYVPSYSLFFVIDCTESSSGMLSMNTTVLTVFSTLIAFKECNCPITVILATSTGPVAVCINKKKEDIFIDNPPVFTEIYRWLTAANIQSQTVFGFSQALTAAYNIRCRQQEQESVLIAITSAHFYQTEMGAVGTCISTLQSLKTSTIGVGVGICPKNISKVFSKSVWSDNPLKIGECFSKLSHLDTSEGITEGEITSPVLPEKISIKELNAQLSNKDNRFFTDLTNKLEKIQIFDAACGYYINERPANIDVPSTKSGKGQEPKSNLPDEDLGKNAKWPYKILICQLYDATVNQEGEQNKQEPNPPSRPLSPQKLPPPIIRIKGIHNQGNQGTPNKGNKGTPETENQPIDKYVTFQTLNGKNGIICRLRDLGFTVTVSQNYCNCIAEILSGEYHQVWVICSNGQEAKPSDAGVYPKIKKKSNQIRGDSTDFSHAYQFVETVEMFRQKGGGISFWADQGFTFELDYYLKHVKLYDCDECDSKSQNHKIPVKLRFNGEDPVRGQVLDRKTPATFEKKSFDSDDSKKIANYDYYLYGYNVLKLQEGTTIAGAKIPDGLNYNEICEHIKPFRPFSLSSDKGLVSGCYYVSPKYSNEGDIIIDGAASRLFKELNLEGVKRLVRNMAVCLVNKWRTIAETGHYENMQPISGIKLPPIPKEIPAPMRKFKPIDLVFIYDATKSTEKIKDLIKFQIKNAIDWFKETNADVKIALIAFRDLIYAKKLNRSIGKNNTEYINFLPIDRADELVSAIEFIPCQGGMGDGPEDWNSAFKAYFMLDFKKEAAQIIFFITDDGAHHPDFHSKPDNELAAKLLAEGKSSKLMMRNTQLIISLDLTKH